MIIMDVTTTHGADLVDIDIEIDFDIPPAVASEALILFAKQAHVQILFPYDAATAVHLTGLSGKFTIKDGIDALIAGTCFKAVTRAEADATLEISKQQRGFWFMKKTKCNPRTVKSILYSVIAANIGTSGVLAQEVIPTRPAALEEIIVTAQRVEQSLQAVPISLSAFSELEIQKIGLSSVEDLSGFVPNMLIERGGATNTGLAITIRGFVNPDPAFTVSSKVGTYLDGVYLARDAGINYGLADIARVEVLRGPQGTLWGRNTTGGAINITTIKPSGEFKFKQNISIGNFDYYRTVTTVHTPKLANLSGLFTFLKTERDGMVKNIYPDAPKTLGDDDTTGAHAAFRWEPVDRFLVDYTFDKIRINAAPRAQQLSFVDPSLSAHKKALLKDGATGLLTEITNPYFQAAQEASAHMREKLSVEGASKSHSEIMGHNLTLSLGLDRLTLKSITGYREYETKHQNADFDGGTYDVPLFFATLDERQHQFSQEFQLTGSAWEDRFEFISGVFYFKEKGQVINQQFPTAPISFTPSGEPILMILNAPQSYAAENKSYAIYGQFTYTPSILNGNLHITPGARFTKDDRRVNHYTFRAQAKKAWSKFSPALTLSYDIDDNVNAYLRVASGYNSGLFNARAGTRAAFLTPADEENVVSYELGLKSELLDNRIRINAAAFYADYKDMQISTLLANVTEGAATVISNAGKAVIRGVELELLARATEKLTVGLNFGYTDFKYKEFITSINKITNIVVDQKNVAKPQRVPPKTVTSYVDYIFTETEMGTVSGRLSVNYTDKWWQSAFANRGLNYTSRTIINAKVTWDAIPAMSGRFRVSVWGNNLTNKKYPTYGADFGGLGFTSVTYGDLRTYGVDMEYLY